MVSSPHTQQCESRAPTSHVVTIGNFDGVHRGHQALLRNARQVADRSGSRVSVVTFEPHPLLVVRPDQAPPLLTSVEQKVVLLRLAGADDVVVLPFDRATARWTPLEFVEQLLSRIPGTRAVVVGANFRFGHHATGDVELLRTIGRSSGFHTFAAPLLGGPSVLSSTRARQALAAGRPQTAAKLLGRLYSVSGSIAPPTQRQAHPPYVLEVASERAVPADGGYRGHLYAPNSARRHPAAIEVHGAIRRRGSVGHRLVVSSDRSNPLPAGLEVTVDFEQRTTAHQASREIAAPPATPWTGPSSRAGEPASRPRRQTLRLQCEATSTG